MLSKHALFAGVGLWLAVASASPVMAADRKVEIVNQTGYAIVEFYGSNNGTTDWQEDILGADVLPHNSSLTIDFNDGTGHCIFDFLVIFEDGDQMKEEDIDVCTTGTYTLE